MQSPARVTLYRSPTAAADGVEHHPSSGRVPVDADEIAAWLRERVHGEVTVRDPLLDHLRDADVDETDGGPGAGSLARAFAEARVLSPYDRETGTTMLGAVRYEERALDDPGRSGGVLYDGLAVRRALNARLPADPTDAHLHVALTERALATWGDHDGRWHKRVSVLGQPSLVSVPGLYEAPAKPEAYYEEKGRHAMLSGDAPPREVLEAAVEGDYLVEDDPRTTEALKGYVLQAVDFVATGEAFCDDPDCRLYNAHRQEELVRAQLRDPPFCSRHAAAYDP